MKFHGWDLALNHSGLVEINDAGKMTWYNWVLDKPTLARGKANATFLDIPAVGSSKDKQLREMHRLVWWRRHLRSILDARRPNFVCIEDYAIHATGNSAYQIGELGGTARCEVMTMAWLAQDPPKLRLHDPMSVKMYLAHNGNAHPETVAHEVNERWPETKQWDKLPDLARLDLVVGYGLAQMVLAEHRLRSGQAKLSDFHDQEVRVFNRVTKTYPCSLLDREWITSP